MVPSGFHCLGLLDRCRSGILLPAEPTLEQGGWERHGQPRLGEGLEVVFTELGFTFWRK
jgi:hypothetical protein